TKTWPFELVATPMPSPRYKSVGSFRKSGTESYGISGTFSAFALDCPSKGKASENNANQHARNRVIGILFRLGILPTNLTTNVRNLPREHSHRDCLRTPVCYQKRSP